MCRGPTVQLQWIPMRILLPAGRPKFEKSLSGGERLTLSPVLRTDRELFQRGLEHLSIESRYARFGQGLSALSERELDYLTDVDQKEHVAIGAAVDDDVAGVGRYIVDGDCAEIAVTVLDEFHRHGVGGELILALAAVARSDAISELCFESGADNPGVAGLLGALEINPQPLDGVFERRVRLSDLPAQEHDQDIVAMINEVRAS